MQKRDSCIVLHTELFVTIASFAVGVWFLWVANTAKRDRNACHQACGQEKVLDEQCGKGIACQSGASKWTVSRGTWWVILPHRENSSRAGTSADYNRNFSNFQKYRNFSVIFEHFTMFWGEFLSTQKGRPLLFSL